MGTYRALIVACETYKGDFPPIPNAAAEAKAFGNALAHFGYEPFEIQYFLDDTTANVTEAAGRFFTSAAPDDFVLFYFGGHGRKGDDGALYLALRDTNLKGIVYTSLQTVILNQLIRDCRARNKVIVLDACYSAAIEHGSRSDHQQIEVERHLSQGKGTAILTSSNAAQQAYSREDRKSFTYHLTEGLRNGKADKNKDDIVSLDEWFEYAREGVLSWQTGDAIQNPQIFYKGKEGAIYIGKVSEGEPEDQPATNLPHFSMPPLKCIFDLITRGDVPYLNVILVNPNPFDLNSVEIIGYTATAMSQRVLKTYEKMMSGERVEFTTPLYTDTGPVLQLVIKASDAQNRAFLPAAVQIASTSVVEGRKNKPDRQRKDPASAGLSDDEDESVLDKKNKKTFH